jgi:hypothetical protein
MTRSRTSQWGGRPKHKTVIAIQSSNARSTLQCKKATKENYLLQFQQKCHSSIQVTLQPRSPMDATVCRGHISCRVILIAFRITVSTPEPQTPGFYPTSLSIPEFAPIVVHIAYSLRNPVDGLEFVLPNDSHPFVNSFSIDHFLSSDVALACSPCIHDTIVP